MGFALAFIWIPVFGEDAKVKIGAEIYARNCSACHGARMLDPQGAFDLKTFPRDERERFFNSVRKGKNAMPPWGDLLKREDIEALWAYVMSERMAER